jgi:hypothetical protein
VSWFSSGADCRGDKRYKCWYEVYNDPFTGPSTTKWCRDYEEFCPQQDSGGYLVDWVDQRPPPPPPGQTQGGWL